MLLLLACTGTPSPQPSADSVRDSSRLDSERQLPPELIPSWDPEDFATVYEVGPGQELAHPDEVPWESLGPGTLVLIHHQDEPYRSKWVVDIAATEEAPLVVLGVPSDSGQRPVLSAEDATTRQELDFWSETRGLLKVGGSSTPGQGASWIWIQGLDLRGAHQQHGFTDDRGQAQVYDDNAAALFVESGSNIHLVDCALSDSGNGLFAASASSDVLVLGNELFGNGNVGSVYEHNSYTEAERITFAFNHYRALREGAEGNNLKDRSAATVVRYNRIEDGNRQLDLVDSSHFAGHEDYGDAWVYGNVLIESEGQGNSQIVHWGGDSGDEANYRSGRLHFFHNTVHSKRSGNTTLFRLSSPDVFASATDNVLWAEGDLGLYEGEGTLRLDGNWLPEGWVEGFGTTGVLRNEDNTTGSDPGLDADYRPTSALPDSGTMVSYHPVVFEFGLVERSDHQDIGAFEAP